MTRAEASAPALAELKVLLVDDEADVLLGLRRLMEKLGVQVTAAASGREALEFLGSTGADVVLTDLMMPRMSGAELLEEVKKRTPETEVIILTGFGTVETAVRCMQSGAAHFLTKPFDNQEVQELVSRLGRQVLQRRPAVSATATEMVVADPRMERVVELARRVARSPVPVLIEGESGTGKEVIARLLHAESAGAALPFLAVNTAALPDTLLESELFGHRKGAFTGADRDQEGLFSRAGGGTIFLDEIASMSLAFQGKLLRVLEEKTVRPLGGGEDVSVEFRLVAATNRDLEALIRDGQFREDLYYRLRVVSIPLPPLRERPGDVLALARHFVARSASVSLPPGSAPPGLSDEAAASLLAHRWPGNVRELENSIRRAMVVCWGERILPHHLGLDGGAAAGGARCGTAGPQARAEHHYETGKRDAIEQFQREFMHRALERHAGNVSRAAESCGLTRAAFQRILRSLDIDRQQFVGG